MNTIQRNNKGRFIKGDFVLRERMIKANHLRKGVAFTKTHKEKISVALKGKKGHTAWNKGLKQKTNTGRTHFKKGQRPHNFKGGISKSKGYISFYKSRYKFLKRSATGSHTYFEWENLKAQYNWTCPCCHKQEPEIKLTQDHIIPLSKGGSDNIENIQPLCGSCNSKKWAKIILKYDNEYHTI